MELKFIYPRWGSSHLAWEEFLNLVKSNNYSGVEIDLPLNKDESRYIKKQLENYHLDFIGQHWQTKEVNFKKHKEQLKRQLYNLIEFEPLFINSHTGMDFFSFSENIELLELANGIELETGVIITHETHRSRFSFAAHICLLYLRELPFLKLTSDFSHWCCVGESMLENQPKAVTKAIEHTYHIHARVGSAQSPQVIDPRVSTYRAELSQFKEWWCLMIDSAKKNRRPYITITPEYGPFPYAYLDPITKKPLANQWEINRFIKEELLS